MESKLKRLRPAVTEERSEAPAASASGPDGTRAAYGSATKPHVQNTFTRSDAPVIRNVRRGSATEAISSYHSAGESALVEELIQDRIAKSSYASAASLLGTWHRFHHEAFDTPAATPSAIPVTIRSIIVVGALFKRGGYRSFENYVSAIKGAHIEAGFDWTQLHAHTTRWATRSVGRGVGPA